MQVLLDRMEVSRREYALLLLGMPARTCPSHQWQALSSTHKEYMWGVPRAGRVCSACCAQMAIRPGGPVQDLAVGRGNSTVPLTKLRL
jgi:hypothetical protein